MIDLAFKTVQTILNKDNQGYVSPTEFNLLAKQAQEEIYQSYFEDINFAYNRRNRGVTNNDYGDIELNIRQKLDLF